MTIEEFLEELAYAADSFVWHVVDGKITGIAGVPMPTDNLIEFCPLAAVCWYKWHHWFGMIEYRKAGRDLGLSDDDAMMIVKTADDRYFPGINEWLRQRLMHVTVSNQTKVNHR